MTIEFNRAIECIERHMFVHTHACPIQEGQEAMHYALDTGWFRQSPTISTDGTRVRRRRPCRWRTSATFRPLQPRPPNAVSDVGLRSGVNTMFSSLTPPNGSSGAGDRTARAEIGDPAKKLVECRLDLQLGHAPAKAMVRS